LKRDKPVKIVAYYRVSTKKQGASGLGLEAQKTAVADYAKHNQGKICAEYTEIESGKHSERPELAKAIAHAKLNKATLVVAKLDRLARNVQFTATLMNSGIDFIACDNPHANRLTIHILAAVAEHEAVQTARRTRDALAAAKARGIKLGSAREGHWDGRENKRGWKKGAKNSAKARTLRAKAAYAFLLDKMRAWKGSGDSYETIANKLNEEGHQTTSGKPFTGTAVWRIMKRYETNAA
jgi:DNA invertase Pin-like site-specific DNA recombinase